MDKFQIWEKEVDETLIRRHGLGIDDIPDMAWYSWFKSGMTPKQAATKAIKIMKTDGWW